MRSLCLEVGQPVHRSHETGLDCVGCYILHGHPHPSKQDELVLYVGDSAPPDDAEHQDQILVLRKEQQTGRESL